MKNKTSSRGQSGSSTSEVGYIRWNEVASLLRARHYERIAEVIRSVQEMGEGNDEVMLSLLEAIYQICAAAEECRDEIEESKRSFEHAVNQENELQKQLHALITIVIGKDDDDHRRFWSASPEIGRNLPEVYGTSASLGDQRTHLSIKEVPGETNKFPRAGERDLISDKPDLVIYCLGHFEVYHDNEPIRSGLNGKASAILKYLVVNREYPVAKEVLMELFWPGSSPDAARNNLNVAIYGLRQALRAIRPDFSHILFRDDRYLFNPDLHIWVDIEEFTYHFNLAQKLEGQGSQRAALNEYRAAQVIYQGEFLEEDRYEEWVRPLRQDLRDSYLFLLERLSSYYLDREEYDTCANICRRIIAVEPGQEEIHQRLMHCYILQGQRYLALRQYHHCVEALTNEFNIEPSQSTVDIYENIRQL